MTQVSGARPPLLFIGGLVLGGVVWFVIFALAWVLSSTREFLLASLVLGGGGAFITAEVTATFQPEARILWNTGFAWPMLCWGLLCAALVPFNSIALLWWAFCGIMMMAAALLGAWLGQLVGGRSHKG